MSHANNSWYVITGGPAVGKSTLLAELEKLGYTTFPEAARTVIDEAMASGKTIHDVRTDEYRFQIDVLERKLKTELEHANSVLTFFDRGIHDTLAYLRLRGLQIRDYVTKAMADAAYRQVFLLEPLAHYDQDYARIESANEARKLQGLLSDAYEEYGMKPTRVPVLPPADRAQFVLDHLKQDRPT